MTPVSPVLTPEFQDLEVVYAKDQPEYTPLPVIRNKDGIVLSRWSLTQEERDAVARGEDIYLYNCTFNHPLQPVRLEIGDCDRTTIDKAEFMGLLEDCLASV